MSAVLDLPRTQTTSLSAIKKAVKLALDEQVSVILSNVSWNTYQNTIQEFNEKQSPRFYYEKGNLFIMPTSLEHEAIIFFLELFINFVTVEWQIDCTGFRSATFQSEEIADGFEPDSCFYFGANEAIMLGKKRFNSSQDPAPDLIIEVDITSLSTNRQSIFAAFGVPEIWRFDGEKMQILKLENSQYTEIPNSLTLPKVTPEKLTEFLQKSETLSRLEWISEVRNWAKSV